MSCFSRHVGSSLWLSLVLKNILKNGDIIDYNFSSFRIDWMFYRHLNIFSTFVISFVLIILKDKHEIVCFAFTRVVNWDMKTLAFKTNDSIAFLRGFYFPDWKPFPDWLI